MKHSLTAHLGTDSIRLGSKLSDNPVIIESMALRECFTDNSGSTRVVLPSLLCVNMDAAETIELIEAAPPVQLFAPCGTPIDLDPKSLTISFPDAVVEENGYSVYILNLDVAIRLTCPFDEATTEDIEVVSIGNKGYFSFLG